jgi:hypothetical protein
VHLIDSCEKIFGGLFQYIKEIFKNKMHPQTKIIPFRIPRKAPKRELNCDKTGAEKM